MGFKRQKHVRKVLTFYKNNFELAPPYQILVDGTFCKAALTYKINIMDQMPKYLDAEVVLFTTSCVMAECESFGTFLYGPWKVLQQYKLYPCSHGKPVSASLCLKQIIGKKNKKKLLLATQDQSLRETMKKTLGLPVLFIAYNAINLEAPSDKSVNRADKELDSRISTSEHSQSVIKQLKKETFGEEEVKRKKRKRPKGPNPLSCKKKKKTVQDNPVGKSKKKKRKKKVKLPFHLKEHLTTFSVESK